MSPGLVPATREVQMKTLLLIVAIAVVGLLATMEAASAATHHKTMAKTCAAEPGSVAALFCPPPAPPSPHKHKQ
jgi:hypothetical protein